MRGAAGAAALICAVASTAAAGDGRIGASYGTAAAEVTTVGVVAIHVYTASSPGHGIGLAVNFLPAAVGMGAGLWAEHEDLSPVPPNIFHGALAGGLPLFALGAVIDGRDDPNAFRTGTFAAIFGIAGAVGGGVLSTRVQTIEETVPFLVAPFAGALGGGLVFAVVSFFDDDGPRSDGRLAKYAGIGGLLGTAGSLAYAFPTRSPTNGTGARLGAGVLREDHTTIISFGGAF